MKKLEKNTKLPTRRNRSKYAGLEKTYSLKSRQEEVDDLKSYSHTIPDEVIEVTLADGTKKMMNPREWLNSFAEEEIHANFQHNGPKLSKSKKDKKRAYNKNNARNRCIYTKEKSKGMLEYVERLNDFEPILGQSDEEDTN